MEKIMCSVKDKKVKMKDRRRAVKEIKRTIGVFNKKAVDTNSKFYVALSHKQKQNLRDNLKYITQYRIK